MYGFVYMTTNLVNGKKYIGMCKNTHSKQYIGSGKVLKDAIKKYGKENFERIVLEECDTFEDLSEAERKWIEKYDAVNNPDFYNLTPGGFGGSSEYMKEYWSNLSDEQRKISRNWSRKDMTGQNNPMFGKKHSEETKKKIGTKSVDRNWKKPNHFGAKNPRAKKVLVEYENNIEYYECLKDFYDKNKSVSYSMLKYLARTGKESKRHKIKITYV